MDNSISKQWFTTKQFFSKILIFEMEGMDDEFLLNCNTRY